MRGTKGTHGQLGAVEQERTGLLNRLQRSMGHAPSLLISWNEGPNRIEGLRESLFDDGGRESTVYASHVRNPGWIGALLILVHNLRVTWRVQPAAGDLAVKQHSSLGLNVP